MVRKRQLQNIAGTKCYHQDKNRRHMKIKWAASYIAGGHMQLAISHSITNVYMKNVSLK